MAILSKQIGWSNESNLLWEILKKLNRLAGIIGGLKPKYKVFSALVTQNGDGAQPDSLSNAPIEIGVTYEITQVGDGNDWTVVGAPNNNLGTFFIATGTNPIWGTDGELGFQNGAPVVTVLENTIGNVWFNYYGEGMYRFVSNNLFTVGKTMIIGSTFYNTDYDNTIVLNSYYGDNYLNEIVLKSTIGNAASNSAINHTPLEIRVYN